MQTIKPKLAKLIPLLGSSQSNEAAAAARAMTRMLASVKCDWHDIVKILLAEDTHTSFTRPSASKPKDTGSWMISRKGNWWRKFGEYSATVFRSTSKFAKGDWAVIISNGVDKEYLNDFDSIEEAKEAAEAHFAGTIYDTEDDIPF